MNRRVSILYVLLFVGCCKVSAFELISHQEEGQLRIFSYNIKHGRGMDGKIDLERIASVISQKNPDLVALQEVDKHCKRSGDRDIAKELGSLLKMEHRFGKFMNFQGGEYGMAILSRMPIIETIRHPLPDGAEPRCALEVQVQVEGVSEPISFVGIHNDWTSEEIRLEQVKALISCLQARDNPIILAGDFNGERTDPSMKLLEQAQWKILDKKGEKTWPSDKPKVEIDFFAVRGLSGRPIEHGVIDEKLASDHRPIFAVIDIECAQASAPPRYLSPLDCDYKGRVGVKNIVECGGLRFQVSQRGHDEYNQLSISKQTEISGINVGSFIFQTFPTREGLDNGTYSKKLHFDIYDYGNLNGNKDRELIRAGDNIYVTFLVKFVTSAPRPVRGSSFDNDNIKYWRNLFFQFWPGGVVTHFNSYRHDSPEAKANKFGYVTVLTADYGKNKSTLSEKFEVEKNQWYRMYFQYNPDVSKGRLFVKMAAHKQGLITVDMTTILDLQGNTLYEDKSGRRILPTFGNYHWGGCPNRIETHFTEILVSKEPVHSHYLRGKRKGESSLKIGSIP